MVALAASLANGDFSPAALLRVVPIALAAWALRGLPEWRQDLRQANTAGRVLAGFAVLASLGAAFVSMALLFP
jgi:hypothetical protein